LRPILLTTLTTAAGLTPLMFEKSFQAKFLIPMAVTLTFGLIFATVLTLLIVPVINLIFFDVLAFRNWLWGRPRWTGVVEEEENASP
ncbi:MAG: efflux RND transporter permease subunit, partial [Planctomycetaceae bacterium]|nr:efflux RND transporter permease subunit [Planctomycetaceae bacterium]